MIFQILILVIVFYIFLSTIYIIEPGKNVKEAANIELDNSSREPYIDEVAD